MKLNSKELNRLLEEVSDDVAKVLAKAEMAKASPGEEAPGEETPAGSSAEGSQPEAAPEASPEGSPDAGGAPEGPPAEAPAPEGQPGDEQTQDPATDESAGPEALVAEYGKLPIEELKMHVMAAHAALMQAIGGDGGPEGAGAGDPGAGPGAEAPAPGPGPEAPPAEGMAPEGTQPEGEEQPPIGKAEVKASPGSGGQIKSGGGVCKSELETRLEALEKSVKEKDATISELEDKFGKAAEGLKNLFEKSNKIVLRKSIANVNYQDKPGDGKETVTLSKAEAIAKCNELSTKKDLSKSDREAVMSFVIGNAPQSTIAHLLK